MAAAAAVDEEEDALQQLSLAPSHFREADEVLQLLRALPAAAAPAETVARLTGACGCLAMGGEEEREQSSRCCWERKNTRKYKKHGKEEGE